MQLRSINISRILAPVARTARPSREHFSRDLYEIAREEAPCCRKNEGENDFEIVFRVPHSDRLVES